MVDVGFEFYIQIVGEDEGYHGEFFFAGFTDVGHDGFFVFVGGIASYSYVLGSAELKLIG